MTQNHCCERVLHFSHPVSCFPARSWGLADQQWPPSQLPSAVSGGGQGDLQRVPWTGVLLGQEGWPPHRLAWANDWPPLTHLGQSSMPSPFLTSASQQCGSLHSFSSPPISTEQGQPLHANHTSCWLPKEYEDRRRPPFSSGWYSPRQNPSAVLPAQQGHRRSSQLSTGCGE